ncbi:DUF3800 domain-containing protein [Demequina sp.]|uniref:DUF3800 domain-containing protein n=1 Tax=Demequina sp. TaxID=2050685 RepID=UPI0025C60DC8|nr:DUF3800 domain-containing protein [Demequina sp.]
MLLFYVDECGDAKAWPRAGSKAPTPSDYLVLAAVGIHDSSRGPLAIELQATKERYFGKHARNPDWSLTELKGRYLKHAAAGHGVPMVPSGYAALIQSGNLHLLVRDLGQIFAKFRPTIFSVVVDKAALRAADSAVEPLGAAYSKLYERVALTLGHVNAGEGGMFVADQQESHENYFKSGALHDARRALRPKGSNRPDFDLLMDKPLWVDTERSSWDREMIQLADIVAYSTYEWFKIQSPPQANHYLWDKIAPCFAAHWNTTKAQGGGIMIYPEPRTYPPID